MYKVGYKVVRPKRGKYRSAYSYGSILYYKPGFLTKPRRGYGPLAVFESLEAAWKFVGAWDALRVFSCLYTPSRRKKVWACSDNKRNKVSRKLSYLPVGTRLASNVILVEEKCGKKIEDLS